MSDEGDRVMSRKQEKQPVTLRNKTMRTGSDASSLHLEPGLSTCVVRPNRFDPDVHLPAIAAANFQCIELNCFAGSYDFPWDCAPRVNELRRISADTGVRVYSVHAEGGIGASRGRRSERLAVDMCKIFADLAEELGAAVVVIHAGLPGNQDRAAAVDQLRASLNELAAHVRAMTCRFGWENGASGLSVEEHLEWIRAYDPGAFGFVLDNGHANIAGTSDRYLAGCGGLLCDLHLNDNDGKEDYHRLPGCGSFQWSGLMPGLVAAGYIGPLMLEIEARDRQNDLSAVLKEARASVDYIASGRSLS